jgi:hypothetical protein
MIEKEIEVQLNICVKKLFDRDKIGNRHAFKYLFQNVVYIMIGKEIDM